MHQRTTCISVVFWWHLHIAEEGGIRKAVRLLFGWVTYVLKDNRAPPIFSGLVLCPRVSLDGRPPVCLPERRVEGCSSASLRSPAPLLPRSAAYAFSASLCRGCWSVGCCTCNAYLISCCVLSSCPEFFFLFTWLFPSRFQCCAVYTSGRRLKVVQCFVLWPQKMQSRCRCVQ